MRNQSKKSSAGRNRDVWEQPWATLGKVAQKVTNLQLGWVYYPDLYTVMPSPLSSKKKTRITHYFPKFKP